LIESHPVFRAALAVPGGVCRVENEIDGFEVLASCGVGGTIYYTDKDVHPHCVLATCALRHEYCDMV
jgi:hypothetical protein